MNISKQRSVFKLKADYYDNALKAFNDFRVAAYRLDLELLKWLSDFTIFSLMGSYDLWIILNDYFSAQKKYQQYYYLRQASLVCFELMTDISQHCDKKFNYLLINLIDDTYINNEAKIIRKLLNKKCNDNVSKFKNIRDLTIAHRDHNISKQVKIMNSINADWIIEFSLSYLKLIEKLHYLLNKTLGFIDNDINILEETDFILKYRKM